TGWSEPQLQNARSSMGRLFLKTLAVIFALTASSPVLADPAPKPRWPIPPLPDPWPWLNHWHFDGTNLWDAVTPEWPSEAVNALLVPSSSGCAVQLQGKGKAILRFPAINANTNLNLNLQFGAARFWFAPGWSSASLGGTGPGAYGRLLEVGAPSKDATVGWW